MAGKIDGRLKELGIELPPAPAPAANYVPFVITDSLVFVAGQISMDETGPICGRLGDGYSVEQGRAAARSCALNLLAQLREACDGDLDRIRQVVRLGGFVNCTPDFVDQPAVVNGASDLIVEVFGDRGRHARTAVGCGALPLGVAVEVDGIVRLD
ncbi:MAG: RidA family protein [Paracoccaceae bacterium]|nr:RidA family protein [Paracoccaceae bacterium]MDE2914743.1 RidA family protein [Paracoccaceae bacterium]